MSKNKSSNNQSMVDFFNQRVEDFSALEKEDLVHLALYFEHNMMIMSSELKTLEHIENEKEAMLDTEEITDEELELKFQELSNYLNEQLELFNNIQTKFDELFDNQTSKKLKVFLQDFNQTDDKHNKSH